MSQHVGRLAEAEAAPQQLAHDLHRMSLLHSSTMSHPVTAAAVEETAGSLPPITSPHLGESLTLKGRGNWNVDTCPLAAAPTAIATLALPRSRCPFHLWTHTNASLSSPQAVPTVDANPRPYIDRYGGYDRSMQSALLLRGVGGGQKILEMTTTFYAWALLDEHLKEFFFEVDGAAAHGDRLGHWIVQFMGGEGNPWDDSGREGMRQRSHAKAWSSRHRPPQRMGRRFKLDDCRIWMRLHFLAARQVELFNFPQFQQWYTAFIAHFIRIYEESAPPFAAADAEWSANSDNVAKYVAQGRRMADISRTLK